MTWLTFAVIGAFLNAGYNMVFKVLGPMGNAPLVMAGAMMGGGALMMAGLYHLESEKLKLAATQQTLGLILIGSVLAVLMNVVFLKAITSGPVSLVGPVWGAVVNGLLLLGGLFLLKEHVSLNGFIGIALCIAGVFMIARN